MRAFFRFFLKTRLRILPVILCAVAGKTSDEMPGGILKTNPLKKSQETFPRKPQNKFPKMIVFSAGIPDRISQGIFIGTFGMIFEGNLGKVL